jgi:putative Mg2+ transporter-C (MgtC) family protein
MDTNTLAEIVAYWSASVIQDNLVSCLDVVGALLLGIVMGYERTWHGRAAGMRTYGFVCMASAALTVVVGHPLSWYGGHAPAGVGGDPTRVVQGIVTGVGFLCAGVIMKEGFTIRGLTTAASIWTASTIGVLVGIGFHATAILVTVLATVGMPIIKRVESFLPAHQELAVRLRFATGTVPPDTELHRLVAECGYDVAGATVAINIDTSAVEWRFVAVTRAKHAATAEGFARAFASTPGIEAVEVSHNKN